MADKTATAKKPNIFVRFGRKVKEIFSELKKVTWPTFGKTVAQTGIVIAVVLFFIVIITAVNFGFSAIYNQVFPSTSSSTGNVWFSAAQFISGK